ncbi:MAG: ATPase [Bacteroidales bacterium]|nr:ATPase [Bacteroidales bacterium]
MLRDYIWRIREAINLKLFISKDFVLVSLRILSLLISLIAIGSIIYFHGFPKSAEAVKFYLLIIHASLGFYVFKFLIRWFYDFQPVSFLRDNLAEAIIMLLIFLEGLSQLVFHYDIVNHLFRYAGLGEFVMLPILFVQLYFFLIVGMEAGRGSQYLTSLKIRPQAMLAFSFLFLIFGGALLLMMPEMTVSSHNISFIDALFTSASASCVTGLTVVDTATFFTLKGKVLIMILIQLGGLNIISFATFFATFYKTSTSIKYKSLLKDFLSTEKISDSRNLLREIFIFSLVIEITAAVLLYFSWNPGDTLSGQNRAFYALFHSVSAFNNAGFSLFTDGLFQDVIRNAYAFHIIIMVLIFLGGIGFMNINHYSRFIKQRVILGQKWVKLNVSARLALITSILLIFSGAIVFFILEKNKSLADHHLNGQIIISFFQSVTTRTAGFNTIDIGQLSVPVLIFFIFLMYVGASPGSTGGGIKTTTFALIVKSAWSTIRGESHVEFYNRSIPYSLIDKAYSIALFSFTVIFISVFLLSITEPDKNIISLVFEEFSAISTVGLSTGITSHLSLGGKIIITTSMFVGRIGTLTLAILLTSKVISTNYKFAEVTVDVG